MASNTGILSAGELREIIKIQRPQRTPNGSGGWETTYVDVIAKTYAKVTQKQASADVIASQENVNALVEFQLRHRPENILNGDRIVWRDFNFTVNRIVVDPLRTSITITANSEIETTER